MTPKDQLKAMAEEVLSALGYDIISVLGIKYDVMAKVNEEVDKLSEFKALEVVERIKKRLI